MLNDHSIFDFKGASRQELLDEISSLRLQLGEARQQSNLWYQQLYAISASLKIGFWEWNQISDKVIFYSNEIAELFGLTIDELYARCQSVEGFYQFIHRDDLEDYKYHNSSVKKFLRDFRDAHVFEYRIITASGELRHIREMEFGVFDEQGEIKRSFGVVQDISDHKIAVSDLEKSEQRFFSLFDQLPVGVVEEDYRPIKKVVDKLCFGGIENIQEYLESNPRMLREMVAGTRVTNVNQAMIDFRKAGSKEEFLQFEENIDRWWNAEYAAFYAGQIQEFVCGKRYYEAERVDSRVDGSYFETRSITTIVKGHEDDWARVITIHEDITSRKKDEQALIEAKELAEKASQAKSEFLSSISHELRTPLNAILGFSQLFEYDPDLNQRQRSNAAEINRAGKHLLVLIDEILDLAKIESGDIDILLEALPLCDIVDDALSWVENLAASRKVTIHADSEVLSRIYVDADSIRLKQVFLNLLTNAVKYNRQGGAIFFEIEYPDAAKVRIGIRDTGPGIEDEKLGELFQPFNRLGAEASGTEGTGIGLVITRQLIRLMQGDLIVNSVPGMGTTFWVELPISQKAMPDPAIEPQDNPTVTESSPLSPAGQPCILVAEDNAINRELMAAQMGMLGYRVDFAENGAEALEKWQRGNYYLLLTDIRMPVMNGYDLIRQIRSLEITAAQPVSILAITANAMHSDIEKCLDAGANDVISKPVDLDELKKALKKWTPGQVAELQSGHRVSVEPFQGDTVIDLNVLNQSVGKNPELHRRLLKSFITSLGEQTGCIEEAFSWRNHAKLADAAHRLKSSARSMGALQLGDLCQELERAGRSKRWSDIESTLPVLLAHCKRLADSVSKICRSS